MFFASIFYIQIRLKCLWIGGHHAADFKDQKRRVAAAERPPLRVGAKAKETRRA